MNVHALRRWTFKKQKIDILFSLWFLFPIIATFVISQLMSSIFYDRYLLYTIPGLMLLLASQRRQISLLFISAIIIIWFLGDVNYFTHPTKRPFRAFSSYVKNNIKPEELLINYNGKAHHLWESKFYGLDAPLYSPGGELPFFVGTAQMKSNDVLYSLPDREKLAVIASDNPQDVVIKGYQMTDYKNINGLNLIKMEKIKNF